MPQPDLTTLETAIGASFQNKSLLEEALTHRSYLNEHPEWPHAQNERLEFLGDAVLELVVTEALYARFPEEPEGKLTVFRAALVNYQHLAKVAASFSLDTFMYMSRGERADTARAREVILANAIEALIGALYLDQGLAVCRTFITNQVLTEIEEIIRTKRYKDPKSELQEKIQETHKVTPTYRVLEESGPAHKRLFRVGVFFGHDLIAEGEGLSKQEAETDAARAALEAQ
jgi:ribonuclease-3